MTENDVLSVLEVRYPAPAWAFFPFFRNQTGYQYRLRTADAIAMSLYPSRGLDVYGFEVKVDRGDWLRELRSPEKAEETFKGVDFVIIVAPHAVVQKGEVPAKWGFAIVNGTKLRHVKPAERLIPESANFSRAFVASIMRRSHEAQMAAPGTRALKEKFESGVKSGENKTEEAVKAATEHLLVEVRTLQNQINDFEKASGIRINYWQAGDLGNSVRMLMQADSNFIAMTRDIDRMAEYVNDAKLKVDSLINLYKDIDKATQEKKKAAQVQ